MLFNGSDLWVLCSVCGAGPLRYLNTLQIGTWHLCDSCELNVREHVGSFGEDPADSRRAARYVRRLLNLRGSVEPSEADFERSDVEGRSSSEER